MQFFVRCLCGKSHKSGSLEVKITKGGGKNYVVLPHIYFESSPETTDLIVTCKEKTTSDGECFSGLQNC